MQSGNVHRILALAVAAVVGITTSPSFGDARYTGAFISEIFWDGPGDDIGTRNGQPWSHVYIELRGQPNFNLSDHYLIFLESEKKDSPENQPTGSIDGVFDLAGMQIGTNGYTMILPNGFDRPASQIKAGTTVYQNVSGFGFGEGTTGPVKFQSEQRNGDIENGAFSAFLLKKNGGVAPYVDQPMDGAFGQHDAVLNPDQIAGWTFLDSIGQSENEEVNAYGYSRTFFSESVTPNVDQANHTNIFTDLEPEHLFRYAADQRQSPEAWVMANITDNPFSFNPTLYPETGYVVSGAHQPTDPSYGEIVRGDNSTTIPGVPWLQTGRRNIAGEGTLIQNSLGRVNYPINDGDLTQDESLTQVDLDVVLDNWRDAESQFAGYWLEGDPSGDGVVGQTDLDFVLDHWPAPTDPDWIAVNLRFLAGETNMDGIVNFDDLLTLAQNYGTAALGYRKGDFNYDGTVNFDDLLALAQRYGLTNLSEGGIPAPFGAAELDVLRAMGVAAAPEPALAMFALVVPLACQSRRRHSGGR